MQRRLWVREKLASYGVPADCIAGLIGQLETAQLTRERLTWLANL